MRRTFLLIILCIIPYYLFSIGTIDSPIPLNKPFTVHIEKKNIFGKFEAAYDVTITVNQSERGKAVLARQMEKQNRNMDEISSRQDIFKFDYTIPYIRALYRPSLDMELMAVYVTVEVESPDSSVPFDVNPLSFEICTGSGRRLDNNGPLPFTWHDFDDVLSCEIYPGGYESGYVVYEVPVGESVLLGYGGTWFSVV